MIWTPFAEEMAEREAIATANPRAPMALQLGGARACLSEALAEIARLRRLPVITTCGDCACFTSDDPEQRASGVCDHPERRRTAANDTRLDAAPPDWCPWRGRSRHARDARERSQTAWDSWTDEDRASEMEAIATMTTTTTTTKKRDEP